MINISFLFHFIVSLNFPKISGSATIPHDLLEPKFEVLAFVGFSMEIVIVDRHWRLQDFGSGGGSRGNGSEGANAGGPGGEGPPRTVVKFHF